MNADERRSLLRRMPLPLALIALLAACHSTPKSTYLVYTSNEAGGDMTVIDPEASEAIGTIALGKRPRGIHANGGQIFVALSGSPSAPPGVDESTLPPPDKSADGVGVVDLNARRVTHRLFGGSDPEQFAFSRDGKLMYVSNEDAAGVSVVEIATNKVLANVKTGEEPEGVTLAPDGASVWVTSENEGTVAVIDTATNSVKKTLKADRRPRSIAFLPDGSRAFVTNENGGCITVIDAVKHEVLHQISLPPGLKPMGQVMAKDGKTLYVTTGRGRKLVAIDTATGKIGAAIDAGDRPWGVALSPDERYAFTANGPSNDVSMIDLKSMAVVRKFKTGERPWGVITLAR